MMLILTDDMMLETFESPDHPPNWLEWIDVANEEYSFCSDRGQRYVGQLVRSARFFRAEEWHLVAEGEPDLNNALELVDRAYDVDENRCCFPDLGTLRKHIARHGS